MDDRLSLRNCAPERGSDSRELARSRIAGHSRRLVALVALLFTLFLAVALVADSTLADDELQAQAESAAIEANRAYEAGEYELAAQGYRQALDGGIDSDVLHYNLGNAWFKQGELGEAIASYKRALQRNPRNESARSNLLRAEALIRDEALAPLSLPVFLRPLAWVYYSLSLDEWAAAGAMLFLLLCLLGAVRPWIPTAALHRRRASVLLAGLALACFVMAGVHYDFEIRRTRAVVISGEVEVRSGPGSSYNLSFKIHEGLTVYVDETRSEWSRVHLGGELVGWVPSDQIEPI